MPSGKVHDKISVLSIIPILLIGIFFFHLDLICSIALTLSAFFSQLMFGPDLDTCSSQYKRWGALKLIWWPYSKLISHRSKFSHGLIFGPIVRILYIISVMLFFFVFIGFINYYYFNAKLDEIALQGITGLSLILKILISNIEILKPLIAGVFVGTAIHTFTDKIVSFFKNLF